MDEKDKTVKVGDTVRVIDSCDECGGRAKGCIGEVTSVYEYDFSIRFTHITERYETMSDIVVGDTWRCCERCAEIIGGETHSYTDYFDFELPILSQDK